MKQSPSKIWSNHKKTIRVAITLLPILLIVVLILFVVINYNAGWTGFGPRLNADGKLEPARTLWDWLQLLVIPIVLGVGALLFNRSERRADQIIAADDRRERAMQSYFDRMTELMLDEDFDNVESHEQIRAVAQIRTLTLLRDLDTPRKELVIRFLGGAKLISLQPRQFEAGYKDRALIQLEQIDLSDANLRHADLCGANLRRADLSHADLYNIDLRGAKLTNAILDKANLGVALLNGAMLAGASLVNCDLSVAQLQHAELDRVDLTSANLSNANLSEVLSLTPEQLATVAALSQTTMPDGRKWEGKHEGPYTVDQVAPYFRIGSNSSVPTNT